MSEVAIVVSGLTGSGKTAVLAVIKRALEKENVRVIISDTAVEQELLDVERLRQEIRSMRATVRLDEVNVPRTPKGTTNK